MELARRQLKMWQLSVLSALIWSNVCHAMPQQWDDPNPIVFRDDDSTTAEKQAPSTPSNNGGYPWIVDVTIFAANRDNSSRWPELDDEIFACGGSLIHPNIVLTAAHCVDEYTNNQLFKVIVGSTKWQNTEDYPLQEKRASKIIVHKDYDERNNHRNNFALIILSEPFEIATNVDILRLQQETDRVDGSRCVSSALFTTNHNNGRNRRTYKKVEFSIVASEECQASLRKTELGSEFKLHSSFTCARSKVGDDVRSCKGVGGAPLACPLLDDPSKYVQVGIIGWAYGCTDYGVHPNPAAVRGWIDEIVEENTLRQDSFPKPQPPTHGGPIQWVGGLLNKLRPPTSLFNNNAKIFNPFRLATF